MKSCMPKMAKTSWKAQITPKTLPTAGIALTSEVMMSFMPSLRESSRNGRSTRRIRSCLSGRSSGTLADVRVRYGLRSAARAKGFSAS